MDRSTQCNLFIIGCFISLALSNLFHNFRSLYLVSFNAEVIGERMPLGLLPLSLLKPMASNNLHCESDLIILTYSQEAAEKNGHKLTAAIAISLSLTLHSLDRKGPLDMKWYSEKLNIK